MNEILVKQIEELLKEEDKLSALCNVTAAIYQSMDNINWAGFYFYKNGKLQLGPFQGKVACTSIEVGKGVCGTSYSRKMLLNVQDVNEFDGHIACDPDSCSELVTPIIFENKIFGVLDIDSKIYRRFGIEEEETCEAITKLIGKKLAAK
ncbi:MAG: GAF domain-containing protein [Erysipelotrichaceae bacterium]|nr:GAF domain-containing protein [Erysipelotrichaceae bacterium]